MLEKGVALFGEPAELVEKILRIKEQCGYEDFMFQSWFEKGGFSGREIEDQMQYFAEECLPQLRRACGGAPQRKPEFEIPNFADVRD